MSEVVLEAEKRATGKSVVRKLRRSGLIPGIFYTLGIEPIAIMVKSLALRPIVYTADAKFVRLKVDGATHDCVLKDVSFDPVTDKIVHFDLLGVSADKAIEIEVPVALHGQAIGVRDGGVLEHGVHKLHVSCLPKDMPSHIDVDVSHLKIGQAIHVSDLAIDTIKILDKPQTVLATVVMPKGVDVTTDAASAEPALVAQKGKKEEK